MLYNAGFSVVLDEEKGVRDFAGRAVEIVPPSDKLVACDHVSSVFVQYFGRVVPGIKDKSLLYEQYERGDWIVCAFAYLKELEQDSRFRLVYQSEPVKGKKGDIGGALFHKSAAVIEYEGNSDLKNRPILQGQ
jgi:hypothetical protein